MSAVLQITFETEQDLAEFVSKATTAEIVPRSYRWRRKRFGESFSSAPIYVLVPEEAR